jgi:membrane protease YdiL (CAAX protease family)
VPVLIGIAMLKKDSNIRDYFALKPVSTRPLMPWLGILAIFIVLSDTLTVLLGRPVVPEFLSAAYSSAGSLPLLWLALVFAAPLFEEMFFRGFLYKGFASSAVGVPGAIAITAFLWAAIHMQYDLYGMATIFVLGIVYGLARAWSGSLVVPLILHAVTNLIATAEAALIG